MSSTTIYHHLRDKDTIRATVKTDRDGQEYAELDLGPDVTVFVHETALRRIHDVIGTALAGLSEASDVVA